MLEKYSSLCGPNDAEIVSKEKGNLCQHRAVNQARDCVRQYRIDGIVISGTEQKRCDFLVFNDVNKRAYFIELKGSHVVDALEQFAVTEKTLMTDLEGYTKFYRIVFKSNSHNVIQREVTEWKRKHGRKCGIPVADYRRTVYEENIN